MQWIEILDTLASACKTLSEVPALDGRESKRDSKEPPDGAVGRKAGPRPSAAQVARGARMALELSRFAAYLVRLAEYLSGLGG